jgi:hypothetical protein
VNGFKCNIVCLYNSRPLARHSCYIESFLCTNQPSLAARFAGQLLQLPPVLDDILELGWAFTFWIFMAMLHWTVGQIDSSAPSTPLFQHIYAFEEVLT